MPGGWRLRYSGISLVHQSNGQPLPLSRSWNRTVLMTGLEKGDQFRFEAKLWKRFNEDLANDDNPDISDKIGRAELAAFWNPNQDNTLGITLATRCGPMPTVRCAWNGSDNWKTAAWPAVKMPCAFTPSCSAAMAIRWWTTTAVAPC